ncbi:Protein SZT2 [Aphelenchoides bicaudatus]|nr:Protein SZT2 [Aphelenchoides bicaudatus]
MPEQSIARLFGETDEDAEEVFLLMQGQQRIARNVRAKWFLDKLGQKVEIETENDTNEISVVGMVPRYGDDQPQQLRIAKTTTLTYFANAYRIVFVMDFSPSTFAADENGEICYIRIFNTVKRCLENIVKSFKFPGGDRLHRPQIYATFCAFSPFLCFAEDCILLQGIHVNEHNIGFVVSNLRIKFNKYINKLCLYFQPYIRAWSAQRRKFRCFAKDIEFAILDWSLISMLRMGILGVQMLGPESAQSQMIVVTDGCCAIPDSLALDQVLGQLRGYTICCSFVQADSSLRGAALGHVSFPELFNFIATATFGRSLMTSELPLTCKNNGQINYYHWAFLAWNFKKAHMKVDELPIPDFLKNHLNSTRSHQYTQQYKTSVNKLLCVRLREGYTIRDVSHFNRDGKDMVKIFLTLLWKPSVRVEYAIVAPWRRNFQKICKISVEFYVETAPGAELYSISAGDDESLQAIVESMVQIDNLLVHMQMFNMQPQNYKLPRELAKKVPFFEQRNGRIHVPASFNKTKYRDFAQFWLPVCILNESMWRKWVHVHTLRVILVEDDPLPKRIFTKPEISNSFDEVQCRESGTQVLDMFSRKSTFVLLKNQCFVNILFTRDNSAPQYFYVTRLQYDSPCMIIKIAFVGGMSSSKRNQVSAQTLHIHFHFIDCQPTKRRLSITEHAPLNKHFCLFVRHFGKVPETRIVKQIERPVERILVRYSRVPEDLANIVRLESSNEELSIREQIMHNAIAKYLSCRRTVWELKPTFPRLPVTNATVEFILQLIVKRRLQQGFSIAYGSNGIVNMVRQVESTEECKHPRVQQCVIFGPILADTDLPTAGMFDASTDYSNYMEMVKREDNRRRLKTWPRLATEVWLEPQAYIEKLSELDEEDREHQAMYDSERVTRELLLKEDDILIRAIFTFDQLMHAAESGMHAEEAFVLNKVASVMAREMLSSSVYSYKDVFDPKALMDNADTREFMLMPGLGYSKEEDQVHVDARLESLLKYVQSELMRYCDCSVDALDDAFLWDIVETCEEHFGISRFFAPDNWAFDANADANGEEEGAQQPTGSKYLIQSMNDRFRFRQSVMSNGTSNESNGSDLSYSTKNAMSGDNNSPSECMADEEEEENNERAGSRNAYNTSPLSQSMAAFCEDNDPYSVADEAATGAINNLNAELQHIQMRSNSVPGIASDSEDNNPNDEVVPPRPATATKQSFVTKDLLNEFDNAIAFSSFSIHDTLAQSTSSNSSTSGEKEEPPKAKQPGKEKPKKSGDRSRNASGIATEKKLSKEEGNLAESLRTEKARLAQQEAAEIHIKNEAKEEAIKKFPPIPLGGFGMYARRLGAHRMVIFFVPKNAKTVRLLMPHCTNSFPVFVYFVDKLRMSQRFVQEGCGSPKDGVTEADARGIRTIVEDFTQKARISTLAFLNRQLHERVVDACSLDSLDKESDPLDEFYLRALDAQLRSELEPIRFQLASFDLRQYAERVFEEYMYTKAFIAAAFSSIGQSVAVPKSILQELGSIHSIMQNSCLHLQLYENVPNALTALDKNFKPIEFDPIEIKPIPAPEIIHRMNPKRFFRLANGCVSNFNDFAECFNRLLQSHNFKPVPDLDNYYYFWPYHKAVLRFANVDDVSAGFADVFRAVGDHQTLTYEMSMAERYEEMDQRQRSESGSRILAEAGNATQLSAADMWPLFVQFSIAIIGPDGEMETSPLSTIPNYPHLVYAKYQETLSELAALHQYPTKRRELLFRIAERKRRKQRRHASYSSNEDSEGTDFWTSRPTSSKHSSEGSTEYSDNSTAEEEEEQVEDENEEIENPESMLMESEDELVNSSHCGQNDRSISELKKEERSNRVDDFINQMPKVEQYAVKRLQTGICRMLASEQLFAWARRCEGRVQPTYQLLQSVCQFVEKAAPPDPTISQITANICPEAIYNSFQRSIAFVGDPADGVRRLCKRLKNLRIEYVHLRHFEPQKECVDDSQLFEEENEPLRTFIDSEDLQPKKHVQLFYACFVDNFDALKEFYFNQLLSADNPMDAYKEPPATPPPTSGQPASSPNALAPEGVTTPKRHRKPRALSLSPKNLEARKSLQALNLEFSSSDMESASDNETFDVYEPLKDTPNDRLSSNSDPTSQSTIRRSRLRRQLSRHYSTSNESLQNCGFFSDGETPLPTSQLKHRRSSTQLIKSGEKTPEVIVGSEGTVVGAEQTLIGDKAPSAPTKSVREEDIKINGFSLDWLVSCGVYKEKESKYSQKLEPYLHDFWLVFKVEHIPRNDSEVTVHFLRRHNSPHTQLIRDAQKILDEQIHIVNQQMLLDRMALTEECDQLLIDSPDPANEAKPIHRRITFYMKDRSGKVLPKEVPCADESERRRESSAADDDETEEETLATMFLQRARDKYPRGHFACDAVWYHWFEINPRLQPTSRYMSGSVDWGYRTLHLGLERFAVRNRTNLYVFREQSTQNVVYLRLFPNDSRILDQQFKESPYKSCPEPPSGSRLYSHVLLAVHGIEKPTDEITTLLKDLLVRKLNSRILQEIQDVLSKNAQARLEISDARFIQDDVQSPANVLYYALPQPVNQLLQPLAHYFEQQALLFCTKPFIREQIGTTNQNSGTSTPRTITSTASRSPNPSKLQQSSSSSIHAEQAFYSYQADGAPSNSIDYVPMFFLLNRPPGEGRRDTGLACIEAKIVDASQNPVCRNAPSNPNYSPGSRQIQQMLMTSKTDDAERLELFQTLTKVRRVKSPYKEQDESPVSFVQLAIWQSGNLDEKELDQRFRTCIQQALCDVYIEFGLLAMRIFDTVRPSEQKGPLSFQLSGQSSTGTLNPQTSADILWSKSEPCNLEEVFSKTSSLDVHNQSLLATDTSSSNFTDKAASDIDLYAASNAVHAPHEDSLPAAKQSVRPPASPAMRMAASDKNLDTTMPSSLDELIPSSTAMRPTRISSVGTQVPTALYAAAASARRAIMSSGRNKSEKLTSAQSTSTIIQDKTPPPPINCYETSEYLRDEFAEAAASWMDFVATHIVPKEQQLPPSNIMGQSTTPNIQNVPTVLGVLNRLTFALDCDRAMRKVIQVVFDRLALGLLGERCACVCRPEVNANTHRRLQLLWNAACLSENTEKDYGRALSGAIGDDGQLIGDETEFDENDSKIDIALLAYNEKEYEDALRYTQHQARIKMPDSLCQLCNPATRESQFQLFSPYKEPFIPRKRLLYVVARNETLTLFLYNYSLEWCDMTKDIVERTVLWHNTRSRLLCDIGLHKMGLTHLSTLGDKRDDNLPKDSLHGSNKAQPPSYLLLTWMDPETLIQHDYPPQDLKMPDFSRIPRKYAQLLFKLYRFAEPAFVAKNFALDPFDDQTQQMLTLREDVKGKLNDHRVFSDVHRRLLKGETQISEDKLHRVTCRSHHAHFVQSPLLLFTSWRFRMAAIRNYIGNHELDSSPKGGQVADGNVRPKQNAGQQSSQSSMKKRTASQPKQQPLPSPVKAPANQETPQSTKLLPQLLPSISKTRSKTTHGAQSTSLRQYLKNPVGSVINEPQAVPHTPKQHSNALNFRVTEQELCLLKVQYMLMEDYVDYLQKVGLTLLKVISARNPQAYNLQYTPECTQSPNAWLYVARPGGIIFAHVTFVEPYFSVKFLFWNASQLSDHLYATQTIPIKELEEMQDIELLKNELIQLSHVHSFTYDFHLRMVSKYLTGGSQVLFNPGYNTNAFLIDFLQYYGCRPPFARNCIYEERSLFTPLRVDGATVWDHFLSNDQHFGWKVVRIKSLNNKGDSDDQFMLIAKEQREISAGQAYQLICMILRAPSSQPKPVDNHLELKLYVLMVSDDNKHPLPDTIIMGQQSARTRFESGEFAAKREVEEAVKSSSAPSPLIVSPKKGTREDSNSSSGSVGGEFTRIESRGANKPAIDITEPPKTPSSGHVSRIQSFNGTMNEQMLDELIAMSTTELMNDVGLQPSSIKKALRASTNPKSDSNADDKSDLFRRRATSSDTVAAKKSLQQLARLKQRRSDQTETKKEEIESSARSSSSDTKFKMAKGVTRRNSDFPSKIQQIGGSLTRLDYHAALDDVWNCSNRDAYLFHHRNSNGSADANGSTNEFAIEKVPPRRHRLMEYIQKRNTDIVLPPEQVTYVHYYSNQQRRLQHLLEESAKIKKSELEAFVFEAERTCYVNELWKSLLSSKSCVVRPQSKLFAAVTKHDSGEATASSIKIPQVKMNPADFDSLMKLVSIESLSDEEPRLHEILRKVNFGGLCTFLTQHYEKDEMYRYFERLHHRHFIILNPSCLDSAMMLRDDTITNKTELFILFKSMDTERRKKQNFASKAVHEQFEKLMNYINTYTWLTLLQNAPVLK